MHYKPTPVHIVIVIEKGLQKPSSMFVTCEVIFKFHLSKTYIYKTNDGGNSVSSYVLSFKYVIIIIPVFVVISMDHFILCFFFC